MTHPHDWLLDPRRCPGFKRNEVIEHLERPPYVHHTEYLHVHLPKRYALVNINDHVEEVIERAGVLDGLCFVSAMHITAGVYVNDAESGLLGDSPPSGSRISRRSARTTRITRRARITRTRI